MEERDPCQKPDRVRHEEFGVGTVEFDRGESVIVRFDHGLEECPKNSLEALATLEQAVAAGDHSPPLEVITRMQAATIRSVNDSWGVFSRSRISLLPHQLWVCKRVLEQWPTRWLVADDVGLGKTVEAGLILWPLLSRGTVRRLLILSPASLVSHWHYRLRKMFDIRVDQYTSQADTPKSEYFASHDQVIASVNTLSLWLSDQQEDDQSQGREKLDRLLAAPAWDLLIVDEAHHLNYDKAAGPTLAYRLVEKMLEAQKIKSMLFFTGTPHRGKTHSFIALCELLRPDLFDIKRDFGKQMPLLSEMMIRNNKQNVTDIDGNPLFQKPIVRDETYAYSDEEADFYQLLTDFILSGRTYATELQAREGRAVMLVLVAMQKLASSSVAAIRRAVRKRLGRVGEIREELGSKKKLYRRMRDYEEAEEYATDADRLSELEEEIAELSASLQLMEDEEPRLRELLGAAEMVEDETKIEKLMNLMRTDYAGRQVLFFTEYKATQSLLMSALIAEFGPGCVTFINGDDVAENVVGADGRVKSVHEKRESAAERFNDGEVRFLVSTEAGGEGIDLQESCWTLVHVDLPWNPMRMHQRVGRLNRYGQTEQVEVCILRNPDTVESRVWTKLNQKLLTITKTLKEVMDEPEDLLELVLGMTSPALFRDLYSEAPSVDEEVFSDWFDERTASFGGRDAVDAVKALVGNAEKFEYGQASEFVPRVDLPDLRPFMTGMLSLNGRRVSSTDDGISFKTPEAWSDIVGVRASYSDMCFDRQDRSERAEQRLLAVGHPIVDAAIEQALSSTSSVALVPPDQVSTPVVAFTISDRVTVGKGIVRKQAVGMRMHAEGDWGLLKDWQLLQLLNEVPRGRWLRDVSEVPTDDEAIAECLALATREVETLMPDLDLPFELPRIEPLAVLWPSRAE